MNGDTAPPKRAWVTLLTRTSYLAGAVLLAHSLQKHKSKYPLLILYTDTLPQSCLTTLPKEASLTNSYLQPVEALMPKKQRNLIAARFADTWTKLRVFQLFEYERLVFLDADMMVFRNMDELFDVPLPGQRGEWIAANHACVCNLDGDSWAPEDWKKEHCAYTGLKHPTCLQTSASVPQENADGYKRTHTLLNSGLFIFEPTEKTWEGMLEFLNTNPLVQDYMFPDQDLLADYFRGRWMSVGYQYNALKTMKYWHPEMWRDEEVRNLHYIVDKPWSKRVGPDGVAGYLGRDGETHMRWWDEFAKWEASRESQGEQEILDLVRSEVAKPLVDGEEPESLHGNWKAS